jgi:hypothetical protein
LFSPDRRWFVDKKKIPASFSPVLPGSSTNKTDRHDITEILLKVALNIIKQSNRLWNESISNQSTNNFLWDELDTTIIRGSVTCF